MPEPRRPSRPSNLRIFFDPFGNAFYSVMPLKYFAVLVTLAMAGYGISVFLPREGVFGASVVAIANLPTEDSVHQVIDDGSYVYAAMHEGLAIAPRNADLQNRANWMLLPDTALILSLASFEGNIY